MSRVVERRIVVGPVPIAVHYLMEDGTWTRTDISNIDRYITADHVERSVMAHAAANLRASIFRVLSQVEGITCPLE